MTQTSDADGPATSRQDRPEPTHSLIRMPQGAVFQPVAAAYGTPVFAEDPQQVGGALRDIWRIFRQRKRVVLSCLFLALAIGLLRIAFETPLYTSTVRLQIDQNAARVVEGGNVTPPSDATDFEFLRTQAELIQSRSMAARVVELLKLADDPDFVRQSDRWWSKRLTALFNADVRDPGPQAQRIRMATDQLLERRAIRQIGGSRLVDVSYVDADPQRAQRIASAFGQSFITASLDRRLEATTYAKTFLEGKIAQLKVTVEASDKALLDAARQEQIDVSSAKPSIAEESLASAHVALGNLAGERIKAEQLWRQVDGNTDIALPQFLTNAVIAALRDRRNALVTEYEEKRQTLKPGYPAMIEIERKIGEIDRQVAAEASAIRQSLKAAYDNAAAREAEMKRRIEQLRAESQDFQKRSMRYNLLQRDADTSRKLYEGLLQRYKEIDIAGGVGATNVFVVDAAELPIRPSSPRLLRVLMLSLLTGLGLGGLAAYLLDRLDDTVRSPEELERISSLPTLGVIPDIARSSSVAAELNESRSVFAEAYRSLATSLQYVRHDDVPRTVFITSVAPTDGKSITSLSIARNFARGGLRVLLIDADLRNPSLHHHLDLANHAGLSTYLDGLHAPPETFCETSLPTLTFMPAGPCPESAGDLLASNRLRSLLSVGLDVFDLIIIDGPPVLGFTDAPLLARAAEATVVVVAAGKSRGVVIRNALKRLHQTQCRIVGTVLTKFDTALAPDRFGSGYGEDSRGTTSFANSPRLIGR
jgi:succinoglycan biosynthesis transport protein ExoP